MYRIFWSILKQAVFWLLFFALGRMVFLIYFSNSVLENTHNILEILYSFIAALKLDLATSCYLLFFPFILSLIQFFYSPKWISKINLFYTCIIIVLLSFLFVGDLGIYAEWGTKLNFKAILYLQHPGEVISTTPNKILLIFFALSAITSFIGIWAFLRFFYTPINRIHTPPIFGLLFLIAGPPLLLMGARGGLQAIPINQSQSFYSKHSILNAAANNIVFNLYVSFFENRNHLRANPYKTMDEKLANSIVKKIYHTPIDTTVKVLKNNRPNIVLVILESWSSDLIDIPQDKQVITPQFNKLINSGIYFENVYATGARSEQGMASIFSGFPAHPISTVTVQPDKYVKLPSMIKDLNTAGYESSFLFGGQLIYGNIKSYIMFNQFDIVKEIYDFDSELPRGKLGIHDEYMFKELLNNADQLQEPFLVSLFTLSSHMPFDQPLQNQIDWGDDVNDYLNSAYYTDKCIGDFIDMAKQKSWFDNTLFIFVADHSHHTYKKHYFKSHYYQKIPLLFYGNVIKENYQDYKVERLGIQTNIVATLFGQMGLDHSNFPWSVDMFNPYAPEFAYVSYEKGLNWVRPVGAVNYEQQFNLYNYNTAPKEMQDSIAMEGKAYLQVLYQFYMDQ
jgi:phosphoglycerol transferase MdoB-like AlkP superfamily enzyme